jgi:ADP-ribosylation factor protein 1
MGNVLSWILPKKIVNILIVGPKGGGKTTILYKLKLGVVRSLWPDATGEAKRHIADVELKEVRFKNCLFAGFNLPAEESACEEALIFSRSRYPAVNALIFVVDASELSYGENIYGESSQSSAKARLQQLLTHHPEMPLLVFAHKQDLPNALTASATAETLELKSLQRPWHIEGSTGNSGVGLYEGLDWISEAL